MITAARRRLLRDRDCRLTSRIRIPITDLMMVPIITTINLADS